MMSAWDRGLGGFTSFLHLIRGSFNKKTAKTTLENYLHIVFSMFW